MGETTENQTKQSEPQPGNQKPGILKGFFHHPNFNAVCGVVTILSLILTIYFYIETIQNPDLTYYISPTRAPIVQKGNLNNFSVTFWGKQVAGDLSAAEIQIWNRGKSAILGTDVLNGGDIEKQIVLKTTNGEPIYQATITPTRDVIGASDLGITNHLSGIMPINWKILEQNDGIKIQIIYGGSVNLPIIIDGVIKGQTTIHAYTAPENYSIRLETINKISLILILISGSLCFTFNWAVKEIKQKRQKTSLRRLIYIGILIFIIYFLIMGGALSFIDTFVRPHIGQQNPPFGF